MSKRAKVLYALQQIDTRLSREKRRYREVQAHLGESETLVEARTALKEAEGKLSAARAKLRDHELETESVAQKLRETEERLYSGRVKNPKELSDLQKEGEYLKRRRSALEEQTLEDMMVVEQLASQGKAAKERYTTIEAAWRSENADLSNEYDALRQDLGELLGKRKALVKHVNETDMDEYDALRRLRSGVAVVRVRDSTCQVCHVQVPMRDVERAREGDTFMYCSGCERILYVPE
jgi:predicted  nucleic acid-binding Zn-ribbon protein